MEEPEINFPMIIDPMLSRADKIVEILELKQRPQFQTFESQAVLSTVINGLMKPFLPELQVVGQDGNVVHLDKR